MSDPERELERLRRALAAAERPGTASTAAADDSSEHTGTGDPFDAGRIFDAVNGGLGVNGQGAASDREALVAAAVDDMLADPDAAEAWQLARELAPPATVTAFPAAPRNDRPVRRTTWTWLATAAVLLLGIGLGWQLLRPGQEAPVYRSGETRTIAPAMAGDTLARRDPVLRWTALEGARYRVRLLTADLQLLSESPETAAPEFRVPSEVLAAIPAGGTLFWQVEARIPGEGNITSSTFMTTVP